MMPQASYTGLEALLTPEESVLVLIDHQPFQFANLHSHEPQSIVANVVALAKGAKAFGVPTILSIVLAERGGHLIKGLQDVFPEQKPIDRSFINSWQDPKFVEAVKKTGRKKLVIAALWTEVCLAMAAIQAQGEGFDVFAVADASGGASVEAHNLAMERMIQAGIKPITWLAVLAEWQRDWARIDTAVPFAGVLQEHGGGLRLRGIHNFYLPQLSPAELNFRPGPSSFLRVRHRRAVVAT
jgi:nicotinamidase-related amidase